MSVLSTIKRVAVATLAAGFVAAGATGVAAATPTHAGDTINIHTNNGTVGRCSLAYVAGSGDDLYGVSAGHCVDPKELGGNPVKITNARGATLWQTSNGPIKYKSDIGGLGPGATITDYSVFSLSVGVTNTGTVTSKPSIGIPQIDAVLAQIATAPSSRVGKPVPVSSVRPGEIVCKDGSSTGRTCGPVLAVNNSEIFALIPAIVGDSGAALTVNRGGTLHPIGILSSGTPVLFNMFDSTTAALAATGHQPEAFSAL